MPIAMTLIIKINKAARESTKNERCNPLIRIEKVISLEGFTSLNVFNSLDNSLDAFKIEDENNREHEKNSNNTQPNAIKNKDILLINDLEYVMNINGRRDADNNISNPPIKITLLVIMFHFELATYINRSRVVKDTSSKLFQIHSLSVRGKYYEH